MSAAAKGSKLRAWLQFLRAPNLFTVPGDPLAGFMLAWAAVGCACWGRAALGAAAAMMLYSAGLLLNDYFDLAADRRDRPNRPLPAGLVAPGTVLAVAIVLLAAGIGAAFAAGVAAGIVAATLAGLAVAYDAGLKRLAVIGPIAMGACRGLSLCLGAAAAGSAEALASPAVLAAAGMMALYIAAVTVIAARETETARIGLKRYLPAGVLTAGLIVLASLPAPASAGAWLAFVLLGLAAVELAILCARDLAGTPAPRAVQRTIGRLIRNLLVVQSAICAAVLWPGIVVAAGLLVAWPVASVLARRFHAS